jgi:hypothetical protein
LFGKGNKKATKSDIDKEAKKTASQKEHDKKVREGLSYLDKTSNQEDEDKDGKIDEATANKIADKTKKKH